MRGYQLTFFTQQNRMYGHIPLAQWLLEEASRLGLRGATINGAQGGMGHDGVIHSINLFDLSDQPIQVTFILSEKDASDFIQHIEKEQVYIFYVRIAAQFGSLGTPD